MTPVEQNLVQRVYNSSSRLELVSATLQALTGSKDAVSVSKQPSRQFTNSSRMGTNLAAMLAQLKLENKELQDAIAIIGCTTACSSSRGRSTVDIEHLERELQRARNKYDMAMHDRQQQVAELEQLTVRCQEMLQPAGALQGHSPLQHTAAQVEASARLTAAGQRVQCAASMQKYLQQAEQQHKQELLDAQSHVQELGDTLLKAQAQMQEAKSKFITAKANRARSQQGLASAEQQLLAGRAQRSRLQQHYNQSSHMILESARDVAWTWDQVQQLCAAMPVHTSTVPHPAEPRQCMVQAARHRALNAAAAEVAEERGRLVESQDVQVDASDCLDKALLHNCGSAPELVQFVETQIRAAESFKDTTCAF